MKPRNKFEKAVFAQSKKLPRISKAQMKWAFRECIDHFAHRLPKGRTTYVVADCGHSWIMSKHPFLVQQKQYFYHTYHKRRIPSAAHVPAYRGKDSRRNLMRLKSGSIGGTRRDARLSWAYNGYLADIWTLSLLARLWLSGRTTSLMTTFHIAPCIRKSELLTH